jgi:hypothetical protein
MRLKQKEVCKMSNVYPVKILAALNAVMARVGYVQKQGKNAFHNYKYAGEGHLLEVLRPAMVEAGLLLIPSHRAVTAPDEYGNTTVTVDYTLAHKDGDVWPEKISVVGCGNDKNSKGGVGDKGVYKAATGANKYLLFKLFQIETGDDPEQESVHDKDGTPIAKPAEKDPVNAKNAPGVSEAKTERPLTKAQARPEYDRLVKELQAQPTVTDLEAWGKRNKPRLEAMPPDWQQSIRNEYADHKSNLMKVAAQ